MSESVGEVENPSLGDVGAISRSLGSEGSSSVRSGKSMKHVKQKKEKPVQGVKMNGDKAAKGATKEGMQVKRSDPGWYKEVLTKAELIEYYDIKGCYILRPRTCAIWNSIKSFLDKEIRRMGVEECYFPMFVSSKGLEIERNHVEGFKDEVAWVTKKGDEILAEPVAIRPTSETIIYPSFKKWVRSHRDLPLRINQWSNVVRMEMSECTPFIRSREFLWQEGHTAFETKEEADVEVRQVLDMYKSVYEDLLAVPVIQGVKSEKEKFAGALYTTTVEGFIPHLGRAVQGATSHCLGQNFASMFEIQYENDKKTKEYVWQNSWGLTTRSIGVMILTHGDDLGLVLPPRVTPIKAVIIPIGKEESVFAEANKIAEELHAGGIEVKVDARTKQTVGWKFNHYELTGLPLRFELGPKEVENRKVVVVRRDTKMREELGRTGLAERVGEILETMQREMLERATAAVFSKVKFCTDWTEFMTALDAKCIGLCPWCNERECEEAVKRDSKTVGTVDAEMPGLSGSAKSLCTPFEAELKRLGIAETVEDKNCFKCGKDATKLTLFGRSF